MAGLQSGLQRKCREMLTSLRTLDASNLREQVVAGWRLHKLKSSPFVSLSLDMNFRILVKSEGNTFYFHRVVKHDLADSRHINRNASAEAPFFLQGEQLAPSDLYNALSLLGLPAATASQFKGIQTEDELLTVLSEVPEQVSTLALSIYETSPLVIPRTRFTIIQHDRDLERALEARGSDWDIYLHPSQEFIAYQPVSARITVCGSAGTGKTVCAWHRVVHLAKEGRKIGFVCANEAIFAVSQQRLEAMLKGVDTDCFFLLPRSANDILQLAAHVDHLVIDEGQELSPSWYDSLATHLLKHPLGLTLFYDVNQLGGNIETADNQRYRERVLRWNEALSKISKRQHIELFINYRNSREIADFYSDLLRSALPEPIRAEIPVFSAGEVITHSVRDAREVPAIVAKTVAAFRSSYSDDDIAVICMGNVTELSVIRDMLQQLGIPTTTDLSNSNAVLITRPEIIRGHERRVVVACAPSKQKQTNKWGRAIKAYIAFSRARDRLTVVEVSEKQNA